MRKCNVFLGVISSLVFVNVIILFYCSFFIFSTNSSDLLYLSSCFSDGSNVFVRVVDIILLLSLILFSIRYFLVYLILYCNWLLFIYLACFGPTIWLYIMESNYEKIYIYCGIGQTPFWLQKVLFFYVIFVSISVTWITHELTFTGTFWEIRNFSLMGNLNFLKQFLLYFWVEISVLDFFYIVKPN